MNFKDLWTRIGYSQEDLYFEKKNQELIKQMKTHSAYQNSTDNRCEQYGIVLPFKARTQNQSLNKSSKKDA